MKSATKSQWRREARAVIHQVIEDNVLGPVQCLPHADILGLRVKLREAYPFAERRGWAYKVWLEEIRDAVGFPNNRKPRKRRPSKQFHLQNIMPCMREWAGSRGLLPFGDN